jgi:hypothetical protein
MPTVTFSGTALQLDGRPALIQAGGLHYARLPHPDLWLPALERLRAAGYNAVWLPIPWAYHSPAPGLYDFTGPRDLPRLLAAAEQAGLWLLAAVGPRIGAELDAGGLPTWLPTVAGAGPDPRSLQEWWGRLFPLLKAHSHLLAVLVEPAYAGLAQSWELPAPIWPWSPPADRTLPAERELSFPITYLPSGPLDGWGGPGYERLRRNLEAEHPRPLVAASLVQGRGYCLDPFAAGLTWGYWGCPEVYTAYGSGAPVAEGAALTPAYFQARRLALIAETLGSVLAASEPNAALYAADPAVVLAARSDGVTTVACLRAGATPATGVQLSLPVGDTMLTTSPFTVPAGAVRLLPLHWPLAGGFLLTTTLEPLLRLTVAGRQLLALVNEAGGDLLLSDDFRPRHAQGPVRALRTAAGLEVHFEPGRLASFLLDGPTGPLQLLALEPAWAERVWPLDDAWRTTPVFPAAWAPAPPEPERGLVIGPELVVPQPGGGYTFLSGERGFGYRWGPWRGSNPHTWLAPLTWEAPPVLKEPALAPWESRAAAPEVQPDYDDRAWRVIAPAGPLAQEAHGAAGGLVWYRGRFAGPATALTLTCRHAGDVFLNGELIAVVNLSAGQVSSFPTLEPPAPQTIPLPPALLREENVIAVLTESLGHAQRAGGLTEPHGLLGALLDGEALLWWRVRGGLSGERLVQGFPGFADWSLVPVAGAPAVTWHRTTFTFNLPDQVTAPLFLVIERLAGKALLFLNGTLVGRYSEAQGPQRRFWLPEGLWQPRQENELLLAQWPRGAEPGIGRVRLESGPCHRIFTVPGRSQH